ncbi:Putative peptidoglycan binding domain protein [Flavimaricola marinus]|uniref:Putative peptidoglycan binding domain protein n=2 Tax=Flavimaricola marinus TaxID=1819565 RepID=A0A238LG24_9RHOB|nr:Putative peptidoglycan binding domain protein [Flavimaricola marinus]
MLSAFFTGAGWAQENGVWVQVEAQPTLSRATDRARAYASELENVNGYALGSGWYAVALGPYSSADAQTLLTQLRRNRTIPSDSYIVDGGQFRTQFWPIGVGAATTPQPLPGTAETPDVDVSTLASADEVSTPEQEVVVIAQPDETVREARQSEAELDRSEKELLQIALQWAGFYTAAIDGSFGRGTRGAMSDWQAANNFEPTGVLTTLQRRVLIDAYNAVLDGMDLQLVRDEATGIEMQIPTGVVAFAAYAPPFARFEATGDIDATVLLISQPGDQDRLFGLYEILQTLEVIPPEGPRERRNSSFTLEGIDGERHSFITASLENGEIKGYALIWPAGDSERRGRVLAEMQASFTRIDGVLDPGLATPGEEQAVDLVSGLAVRKPLLSRSGFYIDDRGTVLTTLEAVSGCGEVIIDGAHVADVVHTDADLGLAVLRSQDRIAPLDVAAFQTGVPRLQAAVAVAGYPYGGLLASPAVTFGTLADIRGLNGEEEVKRLEIMAQEGDAGGPVLDNGGAVLGMLMPKEARSGQVLPPEVSYSVDADEIMASLDAAGIGYRTTASVQATTPEMLTREAGDITVLVSCWE